MSCEEKAAQADRDHGPHMGGIGCLQLGVFRIPGISPSFSACCPFSRSPYSVHSQQNRHRVLIALTHFLSRFLLAPFFPLENSAHPSSPFGPPHQGVECTVDWLPPTPSSSPLQSPADHAVCRAGAVVLRP